MRFLAFFVALLTFGATPSVGSAADLLLTLDCSKATCYGKKLAGPFKLVSGDTCQNLFQKGKLNFYSATQVEKINKPLSSFTCANAKAGQLICYPSVKGSANC